MIKKFQYNYNSTVSDERKKLLFLIHSITDFPCKTVELLKLKELRTKTEEIFKKLFKFNPDKYYHLIDK